MHTNDITSVGWLHNYNGSIALTIAIRHQTQPVFVTVSTREFEEAGGRKGLNENKQAAVDFFDKYGPGRTK